MADRLLWLYVMNPKGLAVLDSILDHVGPEAVSAVVSARDLATSDDCYERIRQLSQAYELQFYDRTSAPSHADGYALFAGWRWLTTPSPRSIILHDSLLPRYRGFAPLVAQLLNAEPEVGVTAILATSEYDAGPIVGQRRVSISYPIRIATAIERLRPLYAELAVMVVRTIIAGGPITGVPQDEAAATYSLWRDDEDYWIDWSRDAGHVRRFVDAVGPPYRGAKTCLNGSDLVTVMEAEEVSDVKIEIREPGKVMFIQDGFPTVVCGRGLLRLTKAIYRHSGEDLLPLRK